MGYVNSSIEGLATIRSFKKEDKLIKEFYQHQDCYISASYTYHCCKSGFYYLIDILNLMIFVAVLFICVFFKGINIYFFKIKFNIKFAEHILSGSVGLILTQIIMVQLMLRIAIANWTNIESQMTAVERIIEYSNINVESKEGKSIGNSNIKGNITLKNLRLSYPQQYKPLLKDINLEIKSKDKIAIVGRTGIGKTTFLSTFLRLYEYRGDILIDDINTKSLSLQFLRSIFSVIPQNAVIFTGSIRDNIDPYKKLTDDRIWNILKNLNLAKNVTDLDCPIRKNEFSDGQKKLLCFARTMANKNRILILDEPCSNLDNENQVLIYQIIKKEFAESTIILVTHRIPQSLQCNRILLLSEGELIEISK